MRKQNEIVALGSGYFRDEDSFLLVRPEEWFAGQELIAFFSERHLRGDASVLHVRYTQPSLPFLLANGFVITRSFGHDFGYVYRPLRKIPSSQAKRKCAVKVKVVSNDNKVIKTQKAVGYIHACGDIIFLKGFCVLCESEDRVSVTVDGQSIFSGRATDAERIGFHYVSHMISTCCVYENEERDVA